MSLLPERELSAEERRDLADELAAYNARAMRVVAPLLVIVHLANVVLFTRMTAATEGYRQWAYWLVRLHGMAAPVALLFFAVASSQLRSLHARLGDATALFYVLFGALVSANAQRSHAAVSAFIGCALAAAVVVRASPLLFVPSLAAGCALVVAGAFHFQPDPSVAWANTMTVTALGLVTLLAFFVTHRAKTREWIARRALERVNAELETRVQSQVGEIVARAREVEQLNVQLSEKVKERSQELSKALAQLSEQSGGVVAPGTVLRERFEIDRPIGFGGMGVVYRGFDRLTQARVAIKMIQAASAQEIDGLHRFLAEARATASVNHPAVVRSLYVDISSDGKLFQVMELVDGEPLDERLRREGGMPWGVAARLGSLLAEALAAAHAAGIVHRDVKPPNVMLMRAAPGLKLLDFGVSKLRDARELAARATGHRLVGTPEFMAPEQIADAATAGEKADVYALGLVLYQCIAAKGPYAAATPAQWLHAHVIQEPTDLLQRSPDCSPSLATLVMTCLRKDPEARPAAAEAARVLAQIADAAQMPALDALERARPQRAAAPRSLENDPTLSAPPDTISGKHGSG